MFIYFRPFRIVASDGSRKTINRRSIMPAKTVYETYGSQQILLIIIMLGSILLARWLEMCPLHMSKYMQYVHKIHYMI